MRPTLVTLLLFTACGGPASPAQRQRVQSPSPPPVAAALFEEGRSWTYRVDETHEGVHPESGEETRSEDNWTATCRVIATADLPVGRYGRVECDPPIRLVSGVWVSAPSGLYHLEGEIEPSAVTELRDEQRLLSYPPAERREDRFDPAQSSAPIGSITVERSEDQWCWSLEDSQAHASWATVCFSPRGIESGRYGGDGAATQDTSFTLVP